MATKMSPKEVISSIAADWRRRGTSYSDVAAITGYKYQTIANMMTGKTTYFTAKQALMFKPFGYNSQFLMFGEGTLFPQGEVLCALDFDSDIFPESYKLYQVMSTMKILGEVYNDPIIKSLYEKYYAAFTTNDKSEAIKKLGEVRMLRQALQLGGFPSMVARKPIPPVPEENDTSK